MADDLDKKLKGSSNFTFSFTGAPKQPTQDLPIVIHDKVSEGRISTGV
jgi:hypothetical protein